MKLNVRRAAGDARSNEERKCEPGDEGSFLTNQAGNLNRGKTQTTGGKVIFQSLESCKSGGVKGETVIKTDLKKIS